jgi:general stress protein 26
MYTPEVREFLQRPLLARMSVIDDEGYPHTVPVSYILDGDDVIITSVRSTRKVAYIRANPKGALVVGGDYADGAGYLLKGEFSIEEDPDRRWLRRTSEHYHDDPDEAARSVARFAAKDMILLRLRVRRVSRVYG